MSTPFKPPIGLQRSISCENARDFIPGKFRKMGPKKLSANVRVYDGFVKDAFSMARVPLFRSPSYYELCPLGDEPAPREWAQPPPPSNYMPMPLAPFGTFGPKPELSTSIDYSTFHPRRSQSYTGGPFRQRLGDFHPQQIKRPQLIDKKRADRNLERKMDDQRSWRVYTPSSYPTSWENAYHRDQSRFKGLHTLLPFKSVDCYSFSNPRAHKAALLAATMRTAPDFWKYSFPNEYLPSHRLGRLEYHFTHGYEKRNKHLEE